MVGTTVVQTTVDIALRGEYAQQLNRLDRSLFALVIHISPRESSSTGSQRSLA